MVWWSMISDNFPFPFVANIFISTKCKTKGFTAGISFLHFTMNGIPADRQPQTKRRSFTMLCDQ